ncbi:hypothetical protein ABZX39_33550 [Streptomyces collinus]|uniref:hypothetical protein n=1 Tax=Streptomyces collinus TaxID=42684 RepID=UPI0033A02ECE
MPELTYSQLSKGVHDMAMASARNAETINKNAEWMSDEARDTGHIADQIGSVRVDQATIAETQQASRIMQGLAHAVLAYAVGADTLAKTAMAAHQVNKDDHGGINEAVNRSSVGREIYEVDNGWFAQE